MKLDARLYLADGHFYLQTNFKNKLSKKYNK